MNIRETLWKHRPEMDIREVIQKGGNVVGALVNYTLGSGGPPQAMIIEPATQPRRSFEELEAVISEAADEGTSVFIYSGSEPLVRMYDLIRICDRHRDCLFICITGGDLIDKGFEAEMKRVGNFVPLTLKQEGGRE